MILSDRGIKRALQTNQIEIDPPPSDEQYTTSAVDLRAGALETFRIWDPSIFDVAGVHIDLNLAEQKYGSTAGSYLVDVTPESDGCVVLPPYAKTPRVLLCQTRERIHLKPNARVAARVEGRSSLARIGAMVHLTAPIIHAGFNGTITLEMVNHGPFYLRLVPNQTLLCQIVVERLETKPGIAINTKFQGQTDPSGKKKK